MRNPVTVARELVSRALGREGDQGVEEAVPGAAGQGTGVEESASRAAPEGGTSGPPTEAQERGQGGGEAGTPRPAAETSEEIEGTQSNAGEVGVDKKVPSASGTAADEEKTSQADSDMQGGGEVGVDEKVPGGPSESSGETTVDGEKTSQADSDMQGGGEVGGVQETAPGGPSESSGETTVDGEKTSQADSDMQGGGEVGVDEKVVLQVPLLMGRPRAVFRAAVRPG